jgi:hypothetical protein
MMLYSASTSGFYSPEIHGGRIPPDAVEITDTVYWELLAGQASGQVITAGAGGIPGLQARAAPTPAQTAALYAAGVQALLDAVARAWGYNDIASAVTYADEPSVLRFQLEGQQLRAWRSRVWAQCYATLASVTAGSLALPSMADLIASLPVAPAQAAGV